MGRTPPDAPQCGVQDGQRGRAAAEELHSATIDVYVLVGAGAKAKPIAQFVVAATEPDSRARTPEATQRPLAFFASAVILFRPAIQMAAGPVTIARG
jgi:hypothetical protein